jgi:hypothetical protein
MSNWNSKPHLPIFIVNCASSLFEWHWKRVPEVNITLFTDFLKCNIRAYEYTLTKWNYRCVNLNMSSSSSSGVDGPVEFSCLDGCCCKRIIKYLNIFADQYWYKVFFNFPKWNTCVLISSLNWIYIYYLKMVLFDSEIVIWKDHNWICYRNLHVLFLIKMFIRSIISIL